MTGNHQAELQTLHLHINPENASTVFCIKAENASTVVCIKAENASTVVCIKAENASTVVCVKARKKIPVLWFVLRRGRKCQYCGLC